MIFIGIDQGPTSSGYAELTTCLTYVYADVLDNNEILRRLYDLSRSTTWRGYEKRLVVERFINRGFPIGDTVRDSILWGGRFIQRFSDAIGSPYTELTNREWAYQLVGNMKAKDSHVRAGVISVFGEGSELPAKKCGRCHGKTWVGRNHDDCPDCGATGRGRPAGQLSGVRTHAWDAIGLALAAIDLEQPGYLDKMRTREQ